MSKQNKECEHYVKMENEIKCSHHVKLAFNNDEVISYCDTCGEILDRYVKATGHVNYYYTYPPTYRYYYTYPYYTYPSTTPSTTPNPNYWGSNWTCTTGDPYKPEMGSHTSTSNLSDATNLK